MKINQSIQYYIEYITNEKRLASGTIRNYIFDLNSFNTYLSQQNITELKDLSAREIRSWQLQLMNTTYSARSANRALCTIRSWCKYLRKKNWLNIDPFQKISTTKTPNHLPIFFKENEVERIYSDELYPETFNGQRDKLLLQILYETGIRRAEIITLKESNFDPISLTIKVRGKRNKERIIPIENELSQNMVYNTYITLYIYYRIKRSP